MDIDHLFELVTASRDECEAINDTGPAYERLLAYLDKERPRDPPARARTRMLEVLRADPMRSVSDDRSTAELVDMVCGDLLMARARIERLT